MEHLPPVGWSDVATKHDLEALATRHDVDALRMALERFRGDLRVDFASQTRAMFLAIVTIVFTMSGLVLALAR